MIPACAGNSRRCVGPIVALVGLMLTVPGCFRDGGSREPVTVHWDRDQDEYCGMVVSDRRFAAQAIEPQGGGHVFDDIGCLVLWLDTQPWREQAHIWVRDRNADRWIDPRQAHWRSGEMTPSGYGYGASLDASYGTLTFSEVRRELMTRRGKPAQPNPPVTPTQPAPVRP